MELKGYFRAECRPKVSPCLHNVLINIFNVIKIKAFYLG
jgi:hypothetical protein